METIQFRSPEDFQQLIDFKKSQIEHMTREVIDREMALFEFNLFTSSLGREHLEKAHKDTEEFKKEMWDKAKELSKKTGKEPLEEYKKLISFI